MKKTLLSAFALTLLATPLSAQSFQQQILADLGTLRDKYVGLAEAVPESDYAWRPDEGVRSVAEVHMHVVGANFGLPRRIGGTVPSGTPEAWTSGNAEGATRASVVAALNASFDHMEAFVRGLSDARLDEAASWFGNDTNVRGYLLLMQTHLHEHLGQSIAYARTRGVTPPWSM